MSTTPKTPPVHGRGTTVERTVDETLTRKMERRGVVVHDPVAIDVIGERLGRFLTARIDGTFTVSNLARMAGGASKEQFVFDLAWTDAGVHRQERLVLRMDPPASMVETPRIREYELLRTLRDTIPVPEVLWVTETAEELGGPAMVCGFIPGVAAASDAKKTASGLGTTYGPRLRGPLGKQFVEHLAALHRRDWTGDALASFDRPEPGTTDAIDWRLAAFDRAWEEDTFAPHPTVTLTRRWLWEHRPVVDHVSVIHGDYRNGNFLFDEERAEITAILDWELTYLGDRHHDLAYALMEGWGEHDAETGTFYASALVPREELIARYEELSGLSVDPVRLEYYTVLNLYWAVVALIATGPRNAAERMTHLDVMQNFLGGLGTLFLDQLNAIVTKD